MNDHHILVLGGAGYIGSHMVLELIRSGHNVITLDDLSTGHRELLPGGRLIQGRLGDDLQLEGIFSENQIEAVMHFGAFSLVAESVESPLLYYQNNLSQTIGLLKAMVRHKVNKFIFSSSAAVYGEPVEVPISEAHSCNPTNPYGETKLFVERLLQDCESAYGIKFISLRYFNAAGADASGKIGERHEPETHLIPLVLKVALGKLEKIKIYGTDYPTPDGTCIRDYIHVTDLAQAHLLALKALLDGAGSAVYNLGSSNGSSVLDVIECARKVTGHPIPAIEGERRTGDPTILIAGSEKIKKELSWTPRYEHLETIIETAWKWHQMDADKV